MRSTIFVVVAIGLSGCGELDCSSIKLSGSYLFTFRTLSGNCGDLPSMLVQLPSQSTASCTVSNVSKSANQCEADGTTTCVDQANGIRTTMVEHDEIVDADGSRLESTATLTMTDLSGRALCTGTYEAEGVRQ